MLFAGNFPGITQTLPLAIYSALDSGLDAAVAMAALLMFAAFFLLLLIRFLDWRMTTRAPRDRGAADVAGLPLSSTAA
jgi:molybdate transport system permease protein